MKNAEKYHHGHLRETLISEACQQVEQEGATALNLSKLAKKIGVSQPAVYRHFPNKKALAVSVALVGFEQLADALHQATQKSEASASETTFEDTFKNSFEDIKAVTTAYVEFALNNTEIARLMFSMKERVTEPALQDASKKAAVPFYRMMEAAKHCHKLRIEDINRAVRILWATIHGLAMLLMDEQIPDITESPDTLSEHIEATARTLHVGLFTR